MVMTRAEWIDSLPDEALELLSEEDSDTIDMLQGLNPNQLRAATTVEGMNQINAVAGSGKTAVLTKRIAYMRKKGIKPTEILCTTFTKKATEEMTARLSKLVPDSYIKLMTIGTTHSIAYHILKREYKTMNHHLASAFNFDKDILMNNDQKRFMEDLKKEIIKDMSVPFEVKQELNEIAVPQFMKAFGLAKNDNIGHMEYEGMHGDSPSTRMQAYVLFYNRYEAKKWYNRVIDGDDLLFLLVRLFQEHEDVLAKYQRKFKYLLTDEAQDNNNLQWTLIRMLAHPHYNVFLVGDDDQSMYSFRGARPEEFIHFGKHYKDTNMIPLEYNYRSVPGILDAANLLIANNKDRIAKKLRTHKLETQKAVVYSAYKDENDEAKATVQEIVNLVESDGYNHKQIAILYRTNAQSRAFEDQLIMAGLPYVIHGGISFYERAEVKDLVAYLKLVLDPHDNEAFERIYNKPKRYLGKAFLEKAKRHSSSYWKSINDPKFQQGLRYEKNGVGEIISLLDALRSLNKKPDIKAEDLLDYIVQQGGYEKYLKDEGDEEDEGSSRMENVNTLKYVISRFDKLDTFLDYITMMTSTAKHDINGVQLMTIHKSKGLEFAVGFCVGMSEGILPHFKSVEDSENGTRPNAIEEERRLGYVAVTRAEKKCYTSSVARFNGRPAVASRFIKEMADALIYLNVEMETLEEGNKWVNLTCTECHEIHRKVQLPDDGVQPDFVADGVCDGCKQVESLFNEHVLEPIRRDHKQMMREILED
jgi:DNA helicase-2/ATP-dependent DNA helicase PcrA